MTRSSRNPFSALAKAFGQTIRYNRDSLRTRVAAGLSVADALSISPNASADTVRKWRRTEATKGGTDWRAAAQYALDQRMARVRRAYVERRA